MKLFNFLNQLRKKKSAKQIISGAMLHIPDSYRTNQKFAECADLLSHREWELALGSLIDLAAEIKHPMPVVFWIDLAEAADKMQLKNQLEYCRNKIR